MLEELKSVTETAVKRNYHAGSIILYQGEAPRSSYIVIDGVVKVYSISPDGDEQIVIFLVAGDIFPFSWLFKKASAVLFFYEALTNCKVALVPPETLKQSLLQSPKTMKSLINYFANNYTATQIRVNALQQPKAKDKLIYMLYYLCRRYGVLDAKTNQTLIPISLTHQNFASLVGLTRETTAIEMNKLKKQKIITYKKQNYHVHLQKLLQLIGEESFKNIKV